MSKNNVPVLIQQYAESALDTKSPEHIRYNYMIALENIRDFCDTAIGEYNKKTKGKR